MLVEPLGWIFAPEASREPQIQEIQKQIRREVPKGDALAGTTRPKAMVDPGLLKGLGGRAVNEIIFRLLGGCAFIIICFQSVYGPWSWFAPLLPPSRC